MNYSTQQMVYYIFFCIFLTGIIVSMLYGCCRLYIYYKNPNYTPNNTPNNTFTLLV